MFKELGRFAATQPWVICLLWLAAGTALAYTAPHWEGRVPDDDIRFIPERFTSVRAYHLLEKAFPKDVSASNLIIAIERQNEPLSKNDFALVDQLVEDLHQMSKRMPDLKMGRIDSHQSGVIGYRLISADQHCTLINVSLETPFLARQTEDAVRHARVVVNARLSQWQAVEGLNVHLTGMAGVGHDVLSTCAKCLDGTTTATVVLVLVILLFVYRAPLLALIPLCAIAISVWVSLNLLSFMTLIPGVHLMNVCKLFAIVILYGAGTDYCLFLISRYREELAKGLNVPEAITAGVGGVGHALTASAGTVMAGLGLMIFAEFAKLRSAGPAIALSLAVALLASLTLTPALLRICGKLAFWPGPSPFADRSQLARRMNAESAGIWDRISRQVARRPILVWILAVLPLLPLVVIGSRVQANYQALGDLPPHSDSVLGMHAIKRHFVPGETGPITVLISSTADWTSREGLIEIDHLSRSFAALPNVAEVRSLTQPLGIVFPDFAPDPDDETWLGEILRLVHANIDEFRQRMTMQACQHYLGKVQGTAGAAPAKATTVTRLEIILKSDPCSKESSETLQMIKTWLWKQLPRSTLMAGQLQSECYGVTANGDDVANVTETDRARICVLVIIAIFLILLLIVRRAGFAFYLLVSVLLTYYATLGATALTGILWTGSPLTELDWRIPFFLFVILVAVGEDYNIFLMTRALEEKKRYGTREGMRRALAQTGGSITSCGLIMAGTFATLMFAGMGTLTQIGFALAFGVLLDTFIVRPFLVPAFAMLFWLDDAPKSKPTPKPAPRKQSREPVEERTTPTAPAPLGKNPQIDELYDWLLDTTKKPAA